MSTTPINFRHSRYRTHAHSPFHFAPIASMASAKPGSKPESACKEAGRALVRCMQEESCMKNGSTFLECLKKNDIGNCHHYRAGYFECKRALLDMRSRIRGNKFSSSN